MNLHDTEDLLVELRELISEGEFEAAFALCREVREESQGAIDERFYYGAAYALFSLGHIHQAEKWVRFYGEVTDFGVGYLFLEAYLELHKGHPERSLTAWTHILELDPANTFADPLIEELRESEETLLHRSRNPDLVYRFVPLDLLETGEQALDSPLQRPGFVKNRFRGFLYSLPHRKAFLSLILVFGVAALAGVLYHYNERIVPALFGNKDLEKKLPKLPQSGSVTPRFRYTKDEPRFFYKSKKEALLDFAKARSLIVSGRPNRARYLLGKIELSNASFEIKERALQLREAIPRSSMSSFSDPVPLEEVLKEPWIYRGAEFLLRGRILEKPVLQEKVLRFFLTLSEFPQTRFLVLYDFGPGTGREPLHPGAGAFVQVFGEFREKKPRYVIFHAREIQILPSKAGF